MMLSSLPQLPSLSSLSFLLSITSFKSSLQYCLLQAALLGGLQNSLVHIFSKQRAIIEYDSKYMRRQTGRTDRCLDIRVGVTFESEHEEAPGWAGGEGGACIVFNQDASYYVCSVCAN